MPDSTESRALLLQINATTELLRSQLSAAEQAVASFQSSTETHLGSIDAAFDRVGKSAQRVSGLLSAGAGLLIGGSLLEAGKNALEFAANIEHVSERVGVSTDFLQKYHFAASQFGVGTEDADSALQKFSRSLGNAQNGQQKFIDVFAGLGIKSLKDAQGNWLSLEEIFKRSATGISNLSTEANKNAATLTLMGRGAAGLVPVLNEGAAGFDALSAAAEQLGIVLSPEMIAHADELHQKMAAMKLVLDSEMASMVSQNADAIASLAGALLQAAGAVATFINSHPQLAASMLGLLTGGPGRAAIAAGLASGGVDQQVAGSKAIMDKDKKQLGGFFGTPLGALDVLFTSRQGLIDAAPPSTAAAAPTGAIGHGGRVGGDSQQADAQKAAVLTKAQGELADLEQAKIGASGAALAAYNEEITSKKREIGFIKQGADASMASSLAGKQGAIEHKGATEAAAAARKAEEQRLKDLQEDHAFLAQLRAADEALAKAKEQLADTTDGQLAVELRVLQDAERTREDQLADQVAAGRITQARADQLTKIYRETEVDDEILAKRKAATANVDQAAGLSSIGLDKDKTLASLDDQLATTRKQHLELQLKILADDQAALIAADKQALADAQISQNKDAIAKATAKLAADQGVIDSGKQEAGVRQQNQGPLGQYKAQLQSSVGDMNDAFQGVEVDGLKGLETGLTGVIMGTQSVAAAFKSMAASIIQDLIKIGIEKMILGSLGGSSGAGGILGGLFGGGGASFDSGAAFNSAFSGIGHVTLPAFAGGGDPPVGVPSLVGEEGPELFVPKGAGTIIPNHALRAPSMRGMGGSSVVHNHFDLSNSMITEKVYADMHSIARSNIAAAAPAIRASGANDAIKQISRRSRQRMGSGSR